MAGQGYGTIRPLSDAEYGELFSTPQPGRADYDPLAGTERLHDYVTGGRWTGRAAVLWLLDHRVHPHPPDDCRARRPGPGE